MGLSNIFSSIKKTAQDQSTTKDKVIGIDIGSSSIKIVELQNRDNVLTLTTYGELELGPYADENPVGQAVVLPPNIERQALVDILRESASKARQAVFAMPLASSFVTVMSMQATAEEDISPRVRVEARKYIPIPIGEVTLDWAEVDISTNEGATTRDVLLAAIQNDALARFKGLMDTVEFRNTPIEIECFSVIRSVCSTDEANCAIIDVGATTTKLYIVRDGLLQRMYRVRAGGSLFTEKISKEMSISFTEAEVKKRTVQQSDEEFPSLLKLHQLTYERVFREFKQVISEYEKKLNVQVETIYVVGGGAQFEGFNGFASALLEKNIQTPLPFNKVAYPAFMEDTMNTIGSTFAVALGAAIRSFE
ncbi:MAG: pilus assembly protein PilM [Patescibacteria group bacterium]